MSDSRVLVVIETQRVKGYLFASPILRETRGASLLLDRLNRQETETLLEGTSGRALQSLSGHGVHFDRTLAEMKCAGQTLLPGICQMWRP